MICTNASAFIAVLFIVIQANADESCVFPSASVPDNDPAGLAIPVEIIAGASEIISTLDVSIEITHSWVGDLLVTLQSPSGNEIVLLDRPGIPAVGFPGPFGCGGRDVDGIFSDSASTHAEDVCSYSAQPVIVGQVLPSEPLSMMTGELASGTWVLTVSDHSQYDIGTLISVCLITSTTSSCTSDLNGDGLLNFFDVSAFLSAFSSMDSVADINNDGEFNFFDVSEFLAAFIAGCP